MKKLLIVAGAFALVAGTAFASGGAHWSYEGHEGPENWGTLSPEYEMCGKGMNQSPIDLTGMIEAELAPIAIDYKESALDVVNNGHTIKASYDAGSTITVNGHTFKLLQVHWHTPSENHIEGKSFPMEAHFVHSDDAGNLAVISVMYEEGAENAAIAPVWDNMPAMSGNTSKGAAKISAMNMLPESKDYYRFNGSLTTPPCSEGVLWMVMKAPVTASVAQIEKFHGTFHHDTNRPVQPVNARPVLK